MRSKIERKKSQIGLLCVRHCLKFRNFLVVSNVVRCCAVFSHLPVDRVVVVNVEGGDVGGLRRGGLRWRKTTISLVTENMEEVPVTIHKMRLQSWRWQIAPRARANPTIMNGKHGKTTVM